MRRCIYYCNASTIHLLLQCIDDTSSNTSMLLIHRCIYYCIVDASTASTKSQCIDYASTTSSIHLLFNIRCIDLKYTTMHLILNSIRIDYIMDVLPMQLLHSRCIIDASTMHLLHSLYIYYLIVDASSMHLLLASIT